MRNFYEQYYDASLIFHGSLTEIMGTRFDLVLIGKSEEISGKIWESISHELERLNNMLNRFDPSSEIARINKNAANKQIEVSEEMWFILNDCKYYHEKTAGLFDITLNDFSKLIFHETEQAVSATQSDLLLDIGGYAKGYAVKRIQSILKAEKVENCFVDFGKSAIFTLGHHPYGDSWKVSIENPFCKGEILEEFTLINEALSTSGNTPDYSGHIVNPLNGRKNNEKILISIVSEDPVEAEVLTTALIAANREQKEKILREFKVKQMKEFNL